MLSMGGAADRLSSVLARTCRVRVFAGGSYPGPAVKRRAAAPHVLGDVGDSQLLATFADALRIRSEAESPRLMSWPAIILELRNGEGQVVAVVGWLLPDRLRMDGADGDMPLAVPEALGRWVREAAPGATAIVDVKPGSP
jgi:hypothetical protein